MRYYNHTYQRSGTLWGRYKSSLIQSEQYLLELYRYIELNPVRADMVDEPSEYSWSSYACNGLGLETDLQTPIHCILRWGRLSMNDWRIIGHYSKLMWVLSC